MFRLAGFFGSAFVLAVALGAAYWYGGEAREKKIRLSLLQQQDTLNKKANEVSQQRQDTENKVVSNFVSDITGAAKTVQVITKEIPVYVPQKSNDSCAIPLGFVSLYDKATIAANGDADQDSAPFSDQPSPPKAGDTVPVPEWIEQRSGMSLRDIEAVHAKNMQAFTQLRSMYVAMRTWANNSCYAP